MTIQELYHKEVMKRLDANLEDFGLDVYEGRMVYYVKEYLNGVEVWSIDKVKILEYDDDTCGEGCCFGFILEGMPDCIFRPNQLKVA